MRRGLWITFVLSTCGALFSGTLTYREMFVALAVVSGWGLWSSRGGIRAAPLAATRLR